jgi:hypothetical protein
VSVADTHFARLRGLLGRRMLRSDEGLWVVPCRGVHTIGVPFQIDVVYLDEARRVIHVVENLAPFRIAPLRRRGSSVLELPPRSAFWSQTQVGDQFLICSPEQLAEYWNSQPARSVVTSRPVPEELVSDSDRPAQRPAALPAARVRGWFRGLRDTRRAPRSSDPMVCAFYWSGGAPRPHEALNISEAGAYFRTTERWYPGTIIELTLQRSPGTGNGNGGVPQKTALRVLSQVVRSDAGGMGVRFMYTQPDQRQSVRRFLTAMRSGRPIAS